MCYSGNLTDFEKQLGFELKEVEHDSEHTITGEPILIEAVIKEISALERIIKIIKPDGVEEYLHQWKWEKYWFPCCTREELRALQNYPYQCSRYGQFESIIEQHGSDRESIVCLINDR